MFLEIAFYKKIFKNNNNVSVKPDFFRLEITSYITFEKAKKRRIFFHYFINFLYDVSKIGKVLVSIMKPVLMRVAVDSPSIHVIFHLHPIIFYRHKTFCDLIKLKNTVTAFENYYENRN